MFTLSKEKDDGLYVVYCVIPQKESVGPLIKSYIKRMSAYMLLSIYCADIGHNVIASRAALRVPTFFFLVGTLIPLIEILIPPMGSFSP